MNVRFQCTPMSRQWLADCMSAGWTKGVPLELKHLAQTFPHKLHDYEALKQRLLAVAGQAVCLHAEEDLPAILARGQFYRGYNSRTMRGRPINCHTNSASLWAANKGQLTLVTGYALSRDGMWRCHSWCVGMGGKVIETTEKRVLYYGFPMTKTEAETFLANNW